MGLRSFWGTICALALALALALAPAFAPTFKRLELLAGFLNALTRHGYRKESTVRVRVIAMINARRGGRTYSRMMMETVRRREEKN